jgi:hypothetical protein
MMANTNASAATDAHANAETHANTEATPSADANATLDAGTEAGANATAAGATAWTMTEMAIESTRAGFRRCYLRGLFSDTTQAGHVAIVVRVRGDGRVARVESYGACEMSIDAIRCMREEAAALRFEAPAGGRATVTIPFAYGSDGKHAAPRPNDAYAAGAFVAVESMRPRLHNCEQAAKREGKSIFASATMTVDVDARGHGLHVKVDPWQGDPDLLACAAEVLRDAPFAPPRGGRGTVVAPIVFNPRPGTR